MACLLQVQPEIILMVRVWLGSNTKPIYPWQSPNWGKYVPVSETDGRRSDTSASITGWGEHLHQNQYILISSMFVGSMYSFDPADFVTLVLYVCMTWWGWMEEYMVVIDRFSDYELLWTRFKRRNICMWWWWNVYIVVSYYWNYHCSFFSVVPIREASVIVGISSPHRSESLEAVRYCIDTLKSTVPIWKKVCLISPNI